MIVIFDRQRNRSASVLELVKVICHMYSEVRHSKFRRGLQANRQHTYTDVLAAPHLALRGVRWPVARRSQTRAQESPTGAGRRHLGFRQGCAGHMDKDTRDSQESKDEATGGQTLSNLAW